MSSSRFNLTPFKTLSVVGRKLETFEKVFSFVVQPYFAFDENNKT
jgi:hypothetical protein